MKFSILFLIGHLLLLSSVRATDKQNIVLLFVDDLGWSDVGYRNPVFETPNINTLKSEGIDFERAYIPTPTCSPSRASLLTGKEAAGMGFSRHITHENHVTGHNSNEYNLWERDPVQRPSRNWMPHEEVTYAEQLKQYGYYNMFIGKWHLGHEGYLPVSQGFDEMYGTHFHGHPDNYYAPFFKHSNPLAQAQTGDYLTNVLTDKAVDFITTYNREQPFMLSLWYYGVHSPIIGDSALVLEYKQKGLEGKLANYAAMISSIDASVGRVRRALQQKGMDENTVIIFLSDQGGMFSNAPLRGGKLGGETLCEGGARVPMIIHYPGLTNGSSTAIPVSSIDLFPTLMEMVEGKAYKNEAIDGVSLLPLIQGADIEERQLFFLRSYGDQYAAVIEGDWKLIKHHSGETYLYNVTVDPGEKNCLKVTEKEKYNQLMESLDKWEKEKVPSF